MSLSAVPFPASSKHFCRPSRSNTARQPAASAQNISQETSAPPESWRCSEQFAAQPHPPKDSSRHHSCRSFALSRFVPQLNVRRKLLHHLLELREIERLRTITDRLFRRGMHFHD